MINKARGSHLLKLQVEQTKDLTVASLSKEKGMDSILSKLESSGGLEALLTGAPLANSGDNQGTSQELQEDSNPHVYLNRGKKVTTGNLKALGTSKPLLIPDFIDY